MDRRILNNKVGNRVRWAIHDEEGEFLGWKSGTQPLIKMFHWMNLWILCPVEVVKEIHQSDVPWITANLMTMSP
ncbi:uncharacterized protein PITG_09033 [Phytophthora infestans T30-4]|uniref:Uncharacterized protein n=1 Tax=Phytophthora infestans (strain T30-4) TaxID=403677 RepID=D0NDQ8_PHYIT|nr:uncharacterized protein PITG_09018 [Phytophthora infestans T30-4]XP_002903056.1 uncharacterized protein PITG_09033 [Phytophthora infestans T30-4]EEY56215.1 conserved hypothetical protein [Phytophthora infestans T30-4]EEY56226.1 conserved hypothetical protein [Phytophthora infestans T30-4]|eukprot:XP_002903045.1 conserved hypothetical protein [Phytophthora infestans T30-4]